MLAARYRRRRVCSDCQVRTETNVPEIRLVPGKTERRRRSWNAIVSFGIRRRLQHYWMSRIQIRQLREAPSAAAHPRFHRPYEGPCHRAKRFFHFWFQPASRRLSWKTARHSLETALWSFWPTAASNRKRGCRIFLLVPKCAAHRWRIHWRASPCKKPFCRHHHTWEKNKFWLKFSIIEYIKGIYFCFW